MPSSSPAPKPTANFFTSALLLFGGSFGGTHLTALVAPYSQWNGVVGFLMFPIAFMTGMQMWPRIDRLVESIRSIPNRVKKIKPIASGHTKGGIGPLSFVITSIATSILSGLILTPPAMQIVVDPGYKVLITAGAIYGIICWLLIQLGYLQQANVAPKDS